MSGVAEWPVGQVGIRDRPEGGQLLEVDVPEPRHLRVPVHGPAADELGQVVHGAGVLDGRCRVRPPGAGEHQRVRPGEVAHVHLEVVVGEQRPDRSFAVDVGEAVRALLEDDDLPPGPRELHGRHGPAGAAADYDRLTHGAVTRAEELKDVCHDAGGGHRIAAVGALDLARRIAARLDVPGEADITPPG